MKNVNFNLCAERDRLKTSLESEAKLQTLTGTVGVNPNIIANLKSSLTQAIQQNADLKNRLNRVHEVSDLADISSLDPISDTVSINWINPYKLYRKLISASTF